MRMAPAYKPPGKSSNGSHGRPASESQHVHAGLELPRQRRNPAAAAHSFRRQGAQPAPRLLRCDDENRDQVCRRTGQNEPMAYFRNAERSSQKIGWSADRSGRACPRSCPLALARPMTAGSGNSYGFPDAVRVNTEANNPADGKAQYQRGRGLSRTPPRPGMSAAAGRLLRPRSRLCWHNARPQSAKPTCHAR